MNKTNLFETVKNAYIYGYPIVGMYELLYTQIINPKTKTTSFNEFAHTATVASPKTSFIPAPNNDTTYSRAWLDLREQPAVIEVPDTNHRYYSIQLLDLFTETITNIGRRLTGTKSNKFTVIGPDWNGDLPKDTNVIKSDTPFALAFLRVLINDKNDVQEVKDIQNKFRIHRLSEMSNKTHHDDHDTKDLPIYKNSNYHEFFETLNSILLLIPTLKTRTDILSSKQLKEVPDDILNEACNSAKKLINEGGLAFGESHNFWRVARKGIGNYGEDYLQRSVVWHKGALANQPEESLYPSTFQDSTGQFLDGNFDYEIKFNKNELPPVSQFWSLTMYLFKNAFLVDNEIDRYSIGDRTKGLFYDEDGSLTIYIQNKSPKDKNKISNWLPSPKDKFYMTLRLYGPSEDAILGKWLPPVVTRVNQ
ncbi:DUF1254 domain-containing protein [Clostridioides difficile]|nr:DUF1254 domain-containing protein [Clostridioides difficile]